MGWPLRCVGSIAVAGCAVPRADAPPATAWQLEALHADSTVLPCCSPTIEDQSLSNESPFLSQAPQLQFPPQGMAVTTVEEKTAGSLYFLAERLETHAGFPQVFASLRAGHGATLGGVWGSSCGWPWRHSDDKRPNRSSSCCRTRLTLTTFAMILRSSHRSSPSDFRHHRRNSQGSRRLVRRRRRGPAACSEAAGGGTNRTKGRPTSPQLSSWPAFKACCNPLPPPTSWLIKRDTSKSMPKSMCKGSSAGSPSGFRTGAVALPGEFSVRGGILDVFARIGTSRCESSSLAMPWNPSARSKSPLSEAPVP